MWRPFLLKECQRFCGHVLKSLHSLGMEGRSKKEEKTHGHGQECGDCQGDGGGGGGGYGR